MHDDPWKEYCTRLEDRCLKLHSALAVAEHALERGDTARALAGVREGLGIYRKLHPAPTNPSAFRGEL